MRKILNLIFVLFFLLNIPYIKIESVVANDSVWVPLGSNYPYSEVKAIAVDIKDPNVIFIGTWGEGIFKTIDGGESWTLSNNGLGDMFINSLVIDPKDTKIVYAGTGAGVYKSVDGGNKWDKKDDGLGGLEVYSLAIDPQNPNIIYAGISNEGAIEGVFKSSNGGENWENIGLKDETVFSITIKPDNSAIVYAGTYHGVFRSSDYGNSWIKVGLDGKKVNVLKINPQKTNIIYASTNDGLYKSVDAGESWKQIGFSGLDIISFAIDPHDTKMIYAGTDTGMMFKSSDYGDTWEKLRIVSNKIPSVEVDFNGIVYVGTEYGVSKSLDNGKTFKTISNPRGIEALAMDPIKNNTLYAATLDGVFKSEDGAFSWKRIGLDGIQSISIGIDYINPKIIYVGTLGEGIYRSVDGGETWENISQGLVDPYGEPSVVAIAINPDNTKIIYISTWNSFFKSVDGGNSWQEVRPKWNSEESLFIFTIQIDPFNHEILYIGTNSGVFKSTDGGLSWKNIGLMGVVVRALAVNPKNSQIIYAATFSNGIFKSSDGGKSWSNTAISEPHYYDFFSLAVYPNNPETIFAVGLFKIPSPEKPTLGLKFPVFLKSSNGGLSWEEQDIPNTIPYIHSMFIDSESDIVYLGTTIGVFKLDIKTGKGTFIGSNFPNNHVEALLAVKETLYAGSSYGDIGKSIDAGNLWQSTAPYNNPIHFLAVDPKNPSILYAATSMGILKSTDGGDSWDKKRYLDEDTYSIVINPENSNTIYAGTANGIFKSEDSGKTLENIGLAEEKVLSLIIDPKNTSVLYAGGQTGIFKSTDSGKSWSLKKATEENVYTIILRDSNTVYAGTEDGVLKSEDGGETWKESGIKGARVFCMMIDAKGNIFAGTDYGVFLSKDSGLNWSPINNGLTNFYITSISMDSRGIIYVGTDGGGIFKYITKYIIDSKAGSGGSINPSNTVTVNSGSSQTFTITPNTGYKIKDVKVDGVSVGAVSTYTFENVTQDHTIEAVFEPLTYTISASAGLGGSISPSGSITVNYGENKTFTITPNSGYKISNVKVDGASVGALSTYTFSNITSNHTIEATFEKEITQTVIILHIGDKNFTVNGVQNTLDSPPIIKNSRTLVPIRAIVEALGGTVGWDNATRKVTITLKDTTIELWIGKPQAKVNGETKWIDETNHKVMPEIINGRTMLPLRFVTENLGCSVKWDGETKTITITYQ